MLSPFLAPPSPIPPRLRCEQDHRGQPLAAAEAGEGKEGGVSGQVLRTLLIRSSNVLDRWNNIFFPDFRISR
jgi:hypothetical protein